MFQRAVFALSCLLLAACNGATPQSQAVPVTPQRSSAALVHRTAYPITHVVVVMQENRSFDNFFRGFPGADSAQSGSGHGVKYTLQPLPLTWKFDPNHYHYQFLEDYDGRRNDGWDKLIHGPSPSCPYGYNWVNEPSCWTFWTGKVYKQMAFSYTVKSDIQPYWTMAAQYTLGDHNFASTSGPSFGPHQELVAGQDGHADEVPSATPWGCDGPKNEWEYYVQPGQANPPSFSAAFGHDVKGPEPCFTYDSVASLLDNAGVSWRWYKQPHYLNGQPQGSFWLDAFDAIKPVRDGPDYANVITPDWQFLTDISKGKLAQVSWVMPHSGASDHAGGGSGNCGPAWITAIVNAIGQSPYWNSTAIVITWDEWGGWFDHVVPPQYANPATGVYEGLGYRTPLIIISPYAKTHYISKSQHETASSLHFIEKMFALPSLGLDDARADAYDDVFNFSQSPTTFKPIKTPSNYQSCMSQQNAGPEMDY